MSFHISPKAVRVRPWQLPALPIQAFIHVEDDQVFQAGSFLVDQAGKRLVPAGRPARDDSPSRLPIKVVSLDLVYQLAPHQAAHFFRVSTKPKRDLQAGMVRQLIHRDAAPFVELLGSYWGHPMGHLKPVSATPFTI